MNTFFLKILNDLFRLKRMMLIFILFIFSFQSGFSLEMNEILGRPTNNSMTISVLFDQKQEVYWEFGTISGNYDNVSSVYTAAKDTPVVFKFSGLTANTKYYYRTCYRTYGSSSTFSSSSEHIFQTQRSAGSTFTFTIEADEHLYDKKGVRSIYQICLANQAKDKPDFMFTLGDIFGDDHHPYTITSDDLDYLHKDYRQYLGQICHSVPFLICLGNHEGEKDYYLHLTPPYNMAVYATQWRKFYYPNPYPDSFYSGNSEVEDYGMGMPENYYSFTWGDALFVVMDVYRYDCDTSAKPKNWNWSLGQAQYNWLKSTLEGNTSKYKFVFAHHVSGEGRGGIEQAKLFEWGGYEADGTTWGFTNKRPNMEKPIHQLFVDNGVNIFFQGHDHLFAHEVMDGVVYQEVPMPSDSTYKIGMLANADAYVSDTIGGTGHIRVTVSPKNVNVDFVRAYLPADTVNGEHKNGEVAFSYSVTSSGSTVCNQVADNTLVKLYPNPTKDIVFLKIQNNSYLHVLINVYNLEGELMKQIKKENDGSDIKIFTGSFTPGIYMVSIGLDDSKLFYKKLIIN